MYEINKCGKGNSKVNKNVKGYQLNKPLIA